MKMQYRMSAVVVAVTLLLGICTLPSMAAVPAGAASEVVRLVNAERAKEGLPALKSSNSALNLAARKRATELPLRFNSKHERPDGREWRTVLDEYKVPYLNAGENIAFGQKSATQVVQAWMNSPGHKSNILDKNFTHIGVGIYEKDGRLYWAQEFVKLIPGSVKVLQVIAYPFQIFWLAVKTFFRMIF